MIQKIKNNEEKENKQKQIDISINNKKENNETSKKEETKIEDEKKNIEEKAKKDNKKEDNSKNNEGQNKNNNINKMISVPLMTAKDMDDLFRGNFYTNPVMVPFL